MSLRIVFMGTPEFAVPTLTELIGHGHEIVTVYTKEPKPAGRGLGLQLSPVHSKAALFGIPVLTPRSLRGEAAAAEFRGLAADLAIVVAYGLILPPEILAAPQLGCLNLHGSLLPRWRGAAPLQRALMAGDAETGVMVMRMDEGLDTGPVGMAEQVTVTAEMNFKDLHDLLMRIGADLMIRAVAGLSRGSLAFRPQSDEGATYAAKITKEEARIDWSRPAPQLHNLVRGLSPFPGAFFEADWGEGKTRVKVLRSRPAEGRGAPGALIDDDAMLIACGEGALELLEVQRAGRTVMGSAEFRRGALLSRGTVLRSVAV